MRGMTIEAVTDAVHGVYSGPGEQFSQEISSIVTDSRKVQKGGLFVALKGARADGNKFIPGAYADGALCCMSTELLQDESRPYIRVESCEQALKDMAEYYRRQLDVVVVGVTGSVGKTTTREMIAAVLAQKYDTWKTQGNFNNEIGLPLTVFGLREHHEAAVLEMGISDFGEMTRLSKIARPDICVITNIGQCHLEQLGDRDGVLKAKTEIFAYMKPGGTAILNQNDDKLCTLKNDARITAPVFFGYASEGGMQAGCAETLPQVRAEEIESLGLAGSAFTLCTPEGTCRIQVPAPGKHMISNALAAAAVGRRLGLSLAQIAAGVAAYQPISGHGHLIRKEHITILDDCYNASPASMKAGLDVLSEVEDGRRIAVLGDMFELGAEEQKLHRDVGYYAASRGLDVIVSIGTLAKQYEQGIGAFCESHAFHGTHMYFPSVEVFLSQANDFFMPGDSVLVKASHAMRFSRIVEVLQNFEK